MESRSKLIGRGLLVEGYARPQSSSTGAPTSTRAKQPRPKVANGPRLFARNLVQNEVPVLKRVVQRRDWNTLIQPMREHIAGFHEAA